ncbi:hypothetical protein [Myxosarcina sp. GI1]|uniref:hypothetical protein n=1 Tax=Myxosarcina sp. GI1 TaxID=1541065 RepID=UPI000563CA23|nr:hypothetical protein [Myxosarcina sp. GI1]
MSFETLQLSKVIRNWQLAESTKKSIIANPPILEYLIEQKQKYPFPCNYLPNLIEIYFDEICVLKYQDERTIYLNQDSSIFSNTPKFTEWKFDCECAIFQYGSELIVDRTKYISLNLNILENLKFTN